MEPEAIHDDQVRKIRAILSEAQQSEYTKMLEEREKRICRISTACDELRQVAIFQLPCVPICPASRKRPEICRMMYTLRSRCASSTITRSQAR
jgi:hypothetical protein